jgi:hypothetical protein
MKILELYSTTKNYFQSCSNKKIFVPNYSTTIYNQIIISRRKGYQKGHKTQGNIFSFFADSKISIHELEF